MIRQPGPVPRHGTLIRGAYNRNAISDFDCMHQCWLDAHKGRAAPVDAKVKAKEFFGELFEEE